MLFRDTLLNNVLLPVLEVCKKWIDREKYALIISSQAYEGNKVVGKHVTRCQSDSILIKSDSIAGSVDHGIFLVRKDCTTLQVSKGTIVSRKSPEAQIVDGICQRPRSNGCQL